MNNHLTLCRTLALFGVGTIALEIILSPIIYFGVLNALGPSTQYYEPTIIGAEKGADGKFHAHIGDKIFISYIVVRNKINGTCSLEIHRYGENIGGPQSGKRHLLSYAELKFKGENELLRPRWPLYGLVLGYDVDKDGLPEFSKPLLEPGTDKQEFALYVVARYYCNFLDYYFPRYLQGGEKPNQTERVNLIVQRRSP